MELKPLFKDIADAIREKDGTTGDIAASTFPARIRTIPTGVGGVRLESISITAPPTKTRYIIGETFDPTGMAAYAKFSNGKSMYINHSDLTFDPAGPLEAETASVTVSFQWGIRMVSADQPVYVDSVACFGVVWNYADSSTALTRITADTDPNHLVTATVDSEPVPAVGEGAGSSPFDAIMPWSGMEEYNIIGGAVSYKRGEDGFSRTAYDTMVYIPEFWYTCIDDAVGSKRYWYISNLHVDGLEKHPGSGRYVSRYTANAAYKSVSGDKSIMSITRETARNSARQKGTGWQLYDFASLCAVQLLYLVEYADWNSQAKIGLGVVNGAYHSSINTGGTDDMMYHTGRADGTNGRTAVQYRHIENPWGNVYQFVDGINLENKRVYVCLNPAQYADDTTTNYTDAGITAAGYSYIKRLGYSASNSWCFIPNADGGSSDTYVPDAVYTASGWTILYFGGSAGVSLPCGMFHLHFGYGSTRAIPDLGVRLLYIPYEAVKEARYD